MHFCDVIYSGSLCICLDVIWLLVVNFIREVNEVNVARMRRRAGSDADDDDNADDEEEEEEEGEEEGEGVKGKVRLWLPLKRYSSIIYIYLLYQ